MAIKRLKWEACGLAELARLLLLHFWTVIEAIKVLNHRLSDILKAVNYVLKKGQLDGGVFIGGELFLHCTIVTKL
jgi:hypothetical protein